MCSVKELRAYASEHVEWALTARTDKERRIFLQMARTWLEVAVRREGKLVEAPFLLPRLRGSVSNGIQT